MASRATLGTWHASDISNWVEAPMANEEAGIISIMEVVEMTDVIITETTGQSKIGATTSNN